MSKSASSRAARLRRLLRSRRGATAMEFALIAVPLFLLLLYTMDLARYWYTTEAVRSYAAEVMRAAVVSGGIDNPPAVSTCAPAMPNTAALTPGLDPSRLRVTIACTRNMSPQGYVVSRKIDVAVNYTFDFAVGQMFWNKHRQITDTQTTTF